MSAPTWPHLDPQAALTGAASFLVGLHLSPPAWWRAVLTCLFTLVRLPKGATLMDFQQARAIGLEIGQEAAKIIGAALGFVEGVMPGAEPAARHAALVDFVDKQLVNVEEKAAAALGVPATIAAEVAALTANPAAVAWLIEYFEKQAASLTATVPAIATPGEPAPADVPPAPQGEQPAVAGEGV